MSDPAAPALAVRWERVCAALAQTEAPAGDTVQSAAQLLWHILAALYAHPPRVYHTLEHVAACLPWLDEARPRMGNVVGVEFALYLHDSVYVPGRADNEARSADVAAMCLTRLGPVAVRHERAVTQLILATRHDGTVLAGDAALLADIDLAILGSLPDNYDATRRRSVRSTARWTTPGIARGGRSSCGDSCNGHASTIRRAVLNVSKLQRVRIWVGSLRSLQVDGAIAP